jgi:hypothetical protein
MTADHNNWISAGYDDSIARPENRVKLIEEIRQRLAGVLR